MGGIICDVFAHDFSRDEKKNWKCNGTRRKQASKQEKCDEKPCEEECCIYRYIERSVCSFLAERHQGFFICLFRVGCCLLGFRLSKSLSFSIGRLPTAHLCLSLSKHHHLSILSRVRTARGVIFEELSTGNLLSYVFRASPPPSSLLFFSPTNPSLMCRGDASLGLWMMVYGYMDTRFGHVCLLC